MEGQQSRYAVPVCPFRPSGDGGGVVPRNVPTRPTTTSMSMGVSVLVTCSLTSGSGVRLHIVMLDFTPAILLALYTW